MTTSTTGTKEFTNDSQDKIATGGIKYDGGKAPIYRGVISYFPRAIALVASVSKFGADKYAWNGWSSVDDGVNRYSDAMVRHLGYEAEGEVLDPDSGFLHAGHTAWNALARLELMLRESEAAVSDGSFELAQQAKYASYWVSNNNDEYPLPAR